MDNKNSNFEGEYTYPAPDGGSDVQDAAAPVYSQGSYPQPPEWTRNIVVSDRPWIDEKEDDVEPQFNEPEKEEEPEDRASDGEGGEEPPKKEWPMWMQIGVIVLAAIIALVLGKYVLSLRASGDDSTTTAFNPTFADVTPSSDSIIPTTVPMSSEAEKQTTLPKDEEDSSRGKEEKTTEPKEEEPSSDKSKKNDKNKNDAEKKEKIVAYFNESSNRVKTEATKVIKNFEKRTHNEDKLVLPSAIRAVGKSLLESEITDITEPVEYTHPDEIDVRYPAPNARWSSKLTAEDVESATCTENGDEYEITLVLKPCVDPEPAKGTSKAMDCLDVPTVRDSAPSFITAFSAEYYDCVIRCRVEKATGRVVWSNYTAPVVLRVGLDAGLVEFDAEIGLTIEKDYTVIY